MPFGLDPITRLNYLSGVPIERLGADKTDAALLRILSKKATSNNVVVAEADYPLTVKISETPFTCLLIIGCGGTGSYLISNLLQFIASSKRAGPGFNLQQIILMDGDVVEEKNLVRQRFVVGDIGRNKAEVLAKRYSAAFGLSIEYVPEYFSGRLPSDIGSFKRVLIVSAVDNNYARLLIHASFMFNDIKDGSVLIDAGNERYHGQAILTAKHRRFIRDNAYSGAKFKPILSLSHSDVLDIEPPQSLENDRLTLSTIASPKLKSLHVQGGYAELVNSLRPTTSKYALIHLLFVNPFLTEDSLLDSVLEDFLNENHLTCVDHIAEDAQTLQANIYAAMAATSLAIQALSFEPGEGGHITSSITAKRISFDSRLNIMMPEPFSIHSVLNTLKGIDFNKKMLQIQNVSKDFQKILDDEEVDDEIRRRASAVIGALDAIKTDIKLLFVNQKS